MADSKDKKILSPDIQNAIKEASKSLFNDIAADPDFKAEIQHIIKTDLKDFLKTKSGKIMLASIVALSSITIIVLLVLTILKI